ncbi:MAG: DUF5915 domain-containing protein, partial [Oscillospiraceae bacterium]|nr:DUF5915 domain-containing protein [Oscillospiraceae bacterium]
DRWLLSRLNSLVKLTDESLERIDVPRAARAISDFVDELSNWYVRRCRERFWGKGVTSDKKSAFDTLYVTLTTLARILAPFMPFLSETMYQNLARSHDAGAPESVHLTDFPAYDESLINPALDENMDKLIRAVSLGRSCRNAANIKVRQPIATLYLQGAKLSDEFIELLKDELNVKDVELAEGERAFVSYKIKPQLRTLGPRLGKQLAAVRKLLEGLDGVKVVSALNRGESLKLDLDGGIIELSKDDLIIEPIRTEGYAAETDGEMTVALDTTLTPELVNEGFARELISKIQSMRRDAGLEVTDRINVKLAITPAVAPAAQTLADMITTAVLASSLELFGYAPSISPLSIPEKGWYSQEWDINGQPATISISSAA